MNNINLAYSILTLQKQVKYLLDKDEPYSSKGYHPNLFKKLKEIKLEKEKKPAARVEPVQEIELEDEESKTLSPLKKFIQTKPSSRRNPIVQRYLKYQMVEERN